MKPLGFFRGAGALFRGTAFVLSSPSLWGYSAVPVAVALVLLTALGWLGVHEARRAALAIVGAQPHGMAVVAHALLVFALDVVVLLLALVLAVSLAQPLSGWALDGIASAQEEALGARRRATDGALVAALRSLGSSLLALCIGLPALVVLTLAGVLFPPATVVTIPLKVLVSAVLVAWDLLDYPLSRRGLGAAARARWVRANFAATLGFGLVATLLLLLPCAGLVVLPFGVAGAVRLALEAEHTSRLPERAKGS